MNELKPCPFCGKEVKLVHGFMTGIEHVKDGPCIWNAMKSIWVGSDDKLIREWNRREASLEYTGDDELLTWVNTWLDSARFDADLTEEEQDACWIVLSAVARLQREGDE